MTIDVSEAIDFDTAEILSVIRTSSGGYVDGIYVPGSESLFTALISSQQPTAAEVLKLPEGERLKDIRKFISKVELLPEDDRNNQIGDIVVYRGNKYKIIQVADYSSYGYSRAFGARET